MVADCNPSNETSKAGVSGWRHALQILFSSYVSGFIVVVISGDHPASMFKINKAHEIIYQKVYAIQHIFILVYNYYYNYCLITNMHPLKGHGILLPIQATQT